MRQNDYKARSFFDQPIPKSLQQEIGRQWMIQSEGRSTNRPKPRKAAPLRSGLSQAGREAKDRRGDNEDVRRRRGHLDDRDRGLLHSTLTPDTHRKAVLQISLLESHSTSIGDPAYDAALFFRLLAPKMPGARAPLSDRDLDRLSDETPGREARLVGTRAQRTRAPSTCEAGRRPPSPPDLNYVGSRMFRLVQSNSGTS